jgi:hypothetical protein
MAGKRPRRGQRILSARKAAQWDEERIRRFEEEQLRKREWIKFTEIAEWYSDLIGPAEPKTAAAARERAYQLLESDSLVGFFEEDGRFLHPGVSPTHWKMTAKRFQQTIENNLDNEQGRYYLRHCWSPKKLFRRWCARHELPESPQRFEPQESHPVPVATAGDETAATKALASHESPQRFEPQESHPVPVAKAGGETAATKALASHLRIIRQLTRAGAQSWLRARGFNLSDRGFQSWVWPRAREQAGLEAKAPPGRKKSSR